MRLFPEVGPRDCKHWFLNASEPSHTGFSCSSASDLGWFAPLRGHLTKSGDTCSCQDRGMGRCWGWGANDIQWVEPRHAAKHPTRHRVVHTEWSSSKLCWGGGPALQPCQTFLFLCSPWRRVSSSPWPFPDQFFLFPGSNEFVARNRRRELISFLLSPFPSLCCLRRPLFTLSLPVSLQGWGSSFFTCLEVKVLNTVWDLKFTCTAWLTQDGVGGCERTGEGQGDGVWIFDWV